MIRVLLCLSALCCTLGFWQGSYADTRYDDTAEPFKVYTYHNKPPYFSKSPPNSTESSQTAASELYTQFVEVLQEQLQRPVKLTYLPRRRLEQLLKAHMLDGAVIGVNPIWFKDKKRELHLWSAPFMHDKDVVVVRKGEALPYSKPDDLLPIVMTIPRGYYFWGVTENIKQNKQEAVLTSSELQSLKLVASKRADATIVSEITLAHYTKTLFSPSVFEALAEPQDTYTRHFLFPKNRKADFEAIAPVIEQLGKNPEWQEILSNHAL